MVKQFIAALKAVRKQYKIDSLNKQIEKATADRTKAKERALKAQAERDALVR